MIQLLMMQLRYFSIPLVPNGDVKIDYFGSFSQFSTVFFTVFVAYLPKVTLKGSLFALHISYIMTQLLMMRLGYFSIPLAPNRGLKISVFWPFS